MCAENSSQVRWDEVLPTVHAACVHLYHVSPSLTQPGTLPLQMARWDCHWRSDPGPGWRKQSWWVETFYIIIYKSNFKFMLTLIQLFSSEKHLQKKHWLRKLPDQMCHHTGSELHCPQTRQDRLSGCLSSFLLSSLSLDLLYFNRLIFERDEQRFVLPASFQNQN